MTFKRRSILVLWAGIAVVSIGATVATAQSRVRTTTLSSVPVSRGDPVGVWSGNAFLRVERFSSGVLTLHVYDQSGAERQRIAVQVPDARLINIYNNRFARSGDGYLAVSGSAYTNNSRGAVFLAVITPDGEKRTVVRTSPYVPYALVFASDGTIWTAGRELEAGEEVNGDYFLIRRFDKKGNLLGGSLPRTAFPAHGDHPAVESVLVAARDRVGWFSPVVRRYVEFSLDGKQLRAYEHDMNLEEVASIALCGDNSVWASVQGNDTAGSYSRFRELDREHGTWSTGQRQPPRYLYGCSGTTLVTSSPTSAGELDWLAIR
jgi:hypothetical protein